MSMSCSSKITVHYFFTVFDVSLSARRRYRVHKLQFCTFMFVVLLLSHAIRFKDVCIKFEA